MNSADKILIYDDSCPMCTAYTNAFVQTGMIEKEGRKNFSTIQPGLLGMVDAERARNEIPLINICTKQVWYGIDALLEILSHRLPAVKSLGNVKPVKCCLDKLYKLISYNRRVITASSRPAGNFDSTPDFNIRYRVAFMVIFLIFNTLMLLPLQKYILSVSLFTIVTPLQLQGAHFFIVVPDILLAIWLGKKKGIDYLGQINMLALIALLLCLPLIIINRYCLLHNAMINSIYLALVTVKIIPEYARRMKYVQIIPRYPIITFINMISIISLLFFLLF